MGFRKSSSQGKQINLRHAWLASLGAAVVARRQARGAVTAVADEASRLRGRLTGVAGEAVAVLRGGAETVRERLTTRATQVRKPAGGRSTARGAARKPATRKKTTSRSAAARKRAERRVAGKGR